jgi:hypothetical protein
MPRGGRSRGGKRDRSVSPSVDNKRSRSSRSDEERRRSGSPDHGRDRNDSRSRRRDRNDSRSRSGSRDRDYDRRGGRSYQDNRKDHRDDRDGRRRDDRSSRRSDNDGRSSIYTKRATSPTTTTRVPTQTQPVVEYKVMSTSEVKTLLAHAAKTRTAVATAAIAAVTSSVHGLSSNNNKAVVTSGAAPTLSVNPALLLNKSLAGEGLYESIVSARHYGEVTLDQQKVMDQMHAEMLSARKAKNNRRKSGGGAGGDLPTTPASNPLQTQTSDGTVDSITPNKSYNTKVITTSETPTIVAIANEEDDDDLYGDLDGIEAGSDEDLYGDLNDDESNDANDKDTGKDSSRSGNTMNTDTVAMDVVKTVDKIVTIDQASTGVVTDTKPQMTATGVKAHPNSGAYPLDKSVSVHFGQNCSTSRYKLVNASLQGKGFSTLFNQTIKSAKTIFGL